MQRERVRTAIFVTLMVAVIAGCWYYLSQPTPEAKLRSIHDPKPGDDEVVGYVAELPILRGPIRIETEWLLGVHKISPFKDGMEPEDALFYAVQEVVNDLLMDEEAHRRGLVVDQEDVEERIAFNLRWAKSMDRRSAERLLSSSGSTADNWMETQRRMAPRWNLHGQVSEADGGRPIVLLQYELQRSIPVTWTDPDPEKVYDEVLKDSKQLYQWNK